ncbi:MAG: hypothetical protein HC869_10555 [Rhodospirillales bacterium]|nr:hypothetical protein [Rhodospirillales bacterium]
MTEARPCCPAPRAKDWASDWRTLGTIWGIPAAAMLAGGLLEPLPRAAVWTIALIWMGVACLANALRCRRHALQVHGPILSRHGAARRDACGRQLPLGRHGWHVLGAATVLGTGLVWWGTERIWGAFSR